MSDNQAQKSTSPSQPTTSQPTNVQDQKKTETAPKDAKSSYGSDNKSDSKSSASGSSSGSR